MKLHEGNINELQRDERAIAKLARIARGDTIYGGARALVLARRLNGMKSQVPAEEVVSEVYSLSNYTCGRFGCYECPECGQSHLGEVMALACCAVEPDWNEGADCPAGNIIDDEDLPVA